MHTFWNHLTAIIINWHLERWWYPVDLFSLDPPPEWQFRSWYSGFIIFCLLAGLVTWSLKLHPPLKSRLLSLFWSNAIIGGILYFFRDQSIPLLGMDLWRFLQEVIFVGWVGAIIYYLRTSYPQERLHHQVQSYRSRYLPKT